MEKNEFGGRKGSAYTPMSEDEQEVISRLVAAGDFKVVVKGWAEISNPRIRFGDLRIALAFRVNFTYPELPRPVHFFDLELRTNSGMLIFKERQPTLYDGKPVQVADGVYLDMVWDIAVMSMDPNLVKAIKPGAIGLTSRWRDRDTGDLTLTGNNKMSPDLKQKLIGIRRGEARSRANTQERLLEAQNKKNSK